MEKPLVLEYAEAESEISGVINKVISRNTIPLFVLENLLANILRQVSAGARAELENAARQYKDNKEG